jgi:ubiquinone/menaquinone biosynthesis C-methylase UbiE
MIALAQRREDSEPMGIEYRVADATRLGRIGEFDRVCAAYLLHYAESRDQLRQMARTAYDNLKPGQRFVASIANILQPPQPIFDQRQYGFSFRLMDETLFPHPSGLRAQAREGFWNEYIARPSAMHITWRK